MIISNFIQSLIAVAMALGSNATPLDVRSPQDPGTLFNGTLFVCAFPNYVLPCANFNYSTDVCVNLTVPFMNSTASATPRDTFSICALFTGPNCTGSSITVSYPGNSNINPPITRHSDAPFRYRPNFQYYFPKSNPGYYVSCNLL